MYKYLDSNIERKSRIMEKHLKRHNESIPVFSTIEFNLCGLCNRTCVFCPKVNKTYPNVNKHMPIELFESVVIDLKKVDFDGSIIFSAFCEPLLYKHLNKVIELSKSYCPLAHIEVVTNGDFLNLKRLKMLFYKGLTVLSISMYDGPWQMEKFRIMRKRAGLTDSRVLFRKRWLPKEEHFGMTLSNRAGAVEIKEIGLLKPAEPLKKFCYYPFYQILVDFDGSVLLCAHDWNKSLIVGTVGSESILDIWNNKMLKWVRSKLIGKNRYFHPCYFCDAEGTLMGENHFEKWKEYYERSK